MTTPQKGVAPKNFAARFARRNNYPPFLKFLPTPLIRTVPVHVCVFTSSSVVLYIVSE